MTIGDRNLLLEYEKVEVEHGYDWTRYYYNEAGNRVRKITMRTSEKDPIDPNWDAPGDDPYWTVVRDIRYIRDVAGNEIALYSGTELDQWNVWGSGNEGKIDSTDNKFFYMKDHLGSVRAVLDTSNTVVSGNDYDIWGYQMDGRSYILEVTDYKFTGKERDKESSYDCFGLRYYDSKIGRWGQREPLVDKYLSWSPYQYVMCNPARVTDVNGADVYIRGDHGGKTLGTEAYNHVNNYSNLEISRDESGLLSTITLADNYIGNLSEIDQTLYNAINTKEFTVNLYSKDVPFWYDGSKVNWFFAGGFGGNFKNVASQYVNLLDARYFEQAGILTVEEVVVHELLEAILGVKGDGLSYEKAHAEVMRMMNDSGEGGFRFATKDVNNSTGKKVNVLKNAYITWNGRDLYTWQFDLANEEYSYRYGGRR